MFGETVVSLSSAELRFTVTASAGAESGKGDGAGVAFVDRWGVIRDYKESGTAVDDAGAEAAMGVVKGPVVWWSPACSRLAGLPSMIVSTRSG